MKQENIHKGHRQRLKSKFLNDGAQGMADHNLLELLLFFGIPQRDTNPIAHELIERFGSFSGVFEADFEQLKSVKGMTENAACLINMLLPLCARIEYDVQKERKSFASADELVKYMKPKFVGALNEQTYVLCLDSKKRLISTRKISDGNRNGVDFDLRALASAVLDTRASSVIIVHNHTNEIPLPSRNDVESTLEVYDFFQSLKVDLVDHIIIAKTDYCSMAKYPKFAPLFCGFEAII